MEYLYHLANASLTLRLIEYLQKHPESLDFVSVIHYIDSWIVKVRLKPALNSHQEKDFEAFLKELGFPANPPIFVSMALRSLETGYSPVEVMRRYQVVVVSHGLPKQEEIEEFRQQFTRGLGYCPPHLA